MNVLGLAELLCVWEEAHALHPLDRGLALLRHAFPETVYGIAADWPLGRRNAALAAVRCACFGRSSTARTVCPNCREQLEFAVDLGALATTAALQSDSCVAVHGGEYRLPTSRDLASIAQSHDAGGHNAGSDDVQQLADRCRLDTAHDSAPLSELALDALEAAMLRADPLAEISFEVCCPECQGASRAVLDLVSFIWLEIDAAVRRLLLEVHTLAAAYAWSEASILSMTSVRRGFYLERLRA